MKHLQQRLPWVWLGDISMAWPSVNGSWTPVEESIALKYHSLALSVENFYCGFINFYMIYCDGKSEIFLSEAVKLLEKRYKTRL